MEYGGKIGTLPTVSRAGYRFLGWYPQAGGGAKVTGSEAITESITLYARWEALKTQKITVASSIQKAYGSKPFSLKAKTNGGGKLSYKSSDTKVAKVDGKALVGLKNGKTYYVKIRTYRKVGGETYQGE